MVEFKIGDYVEVGIGESVHDEDGHSVYFRVDREGYNELDIVEMFGADENVLYVNLVDDEDAIRFAGDKKLSDYVIW